ncbi:LysR family transcriptional regulator [Acinetobacter rudis]|uniref:LysR family transcriptional regulator n=1 Tax=Acinetobacter rudis TaxID=632955 RepID=UPI00281034DC|nr:LysR family transcriptional regulator [Acinetobacter rudis]MDQ8952418.1 LysR family transcriptional regulator [Acinetobacter rudis]
MKYNHQLKSGDMFALTAFLVVASQRSFRLAAVELNLTPSAVSHTIKNLEDRLSVRLFNRTTRSVSLTDAGNQLFLSLQPAMESVTNAVNQLDKFRNKPNGILRINASEGAVKMILKPILKKFLDANPDVHLDIVSNGRMINIVEENFDAGIRLSDDIPQEMVAIRLTPYERFIAVASPEYLDKFGMPVSPYDLYNYDCIKFRFESGEIFQWEFSINGAIKKFNVKGPLTLTDQNLMVEAAKDGIGIAFVPEHLIETYLNSGQVVIVLEDYSPIYNGLSLYYPGHRHVSNALHALIETIRSEV